MHHARKGGARARAGQALRGSSEFHAWGDSNLYLRRIHDGRLFLSVEQRAAPSIAALGLDLRAADDSLALHIAEGMPADSSLEPEPALPPPDLIVHALAAAHAPVPVAEIRDACKIRNARLYEALAELVRTGRILKADGGYVLAQPAP